MIYKPYQHIERLGTDEVEGILDGTVYFQTKIDGSNFCMYLNDGGTLSVGSRNRELTLKEDNQGCMAYILSEPKYLQLVKEHPNCYFFGEWLIKNHIKNYLPQAYKKPYIFDVLEIDDGGGHYIKPDEYIPWLKELDIEYIPVEAIVDNPTQEDIDAILKESYFLHENPGNQEGIILKRYDFKNKYGRTTWAKIVRDEYKQEKSKPKNPDSIEKQIVDTFCTVAFIEKEYCKIAVGGWNSKLIPRLLGTVWHELIVEESWNFIKKFKNPTIDFRLLNALVIEQIKLVKKEIFA